MLMSNFIGPDKFLASHLAKAYERVILDMKGKAVYLSKICEECYDYFDYFDLMRRDPKVAAVYQQKYSAHHRDHIYFMLLVKTMYYISVSEAIDSLEDREKFNHYCKKSGVISSDISV